MRTLEEMETNMRLDDLKQKGGEDKKKIKKPTLEVEPIQIELLQTDIDKLYTQIYAYFAVSCLYVYKMAIY
jgi:pre-mRNA-splicing factor 18